MASFKWAGKKIKYKARLLACDGQPMDQKTALENLKLFDEFMRKKQIKYVTVYGTCLGAVREHGFIAHDEDCDLGVTEENFNKILDNIDDLLATGLQIARYDERGQFSLWRNGEYIDIIAFKERDEETYIACNMYICPKKFIDEVKYVDFCDTQMPVPKQSKESMLYEYGETWTTPIKYEERTPNNFKAKFKAFVKLIIPKKLKFRIWKGLEKDWLVKYENKLSKYKEGLKNRESLDD